MNPTDQRCRYDERSLVDKLTGADVAYHMCVVAGLKQRFEYLDIGGRGGLRLNRVDDVLLRIDYVSAAKRW